MQAATASIRPGAVRRRLLDDYRPVALGAARAWVDFFTMLRAQGRAGVFVNGFLALGFGSLVVAFHKFGQACLSSSPFSAGHKCSKVS